jgi:hypothetical protein
MKPNFVVNSSCIPVLPVARGHNMGHKVGFDNFCTQNWILSEQIHFCLTIINIVSQNYLSVDKYFIFVQTNFNFESKFRFCHNKITFVNTIPFCLDKNHLSRQLLLLSWPIHFCQVEINLTKFTFDVTNSDCKLLADWLKHLHRKVISYMIIEHLLNIQCIRKHYAYGGIYTC